MFTKQELENLAAILSVAKFDNLTIPAAAVGVALLHKAQTLAQAPETNGDSNSASTDKPGTEQPS
jgi:hypothetical protein